MLGARKKGRMRTEEKKMGGGKNKKKMSVAGFGGYLCYYHCWE